MILTDAGPLVALIDERDRQHVRCVTAAARLRGPMICPWPALTEAMYVLGNRGGWGAQEKLWILIFRGSIETAALTRAQLERARALMQKYRDLPMDFADAALVAVAEHLNRRRIFTLDADFRVYRYRDRQAFELIPGAL